MKRGVFLTLENREDFFVYDELAFEPLAKLGWEIVELPWNSTAVDWSQFDAVVIRSTWDYQDHPDHFMATLEQIEASGTVLFNPLDVCRWNIDKSYLKHLEDAGVPIVPTAWRDRIDRHELQIIRNGFGGRNLVIKPTVSANADHTYVVSEDINSWRSPLDEFKDRPLLAQPFIDSVIKVGEFSLFYFGGKYSHAILKKPKAGDFRVQEEHGGSLQSTIATENQIKLAERALRVVDSELLYARIDLVILDDGSQAVMEMELIEPSLYFNLDEQAPIRFATAMDRLVSQNPA